MASALLGTSDIILGVTPRKRTSRRTVRKRLYATPTGRTTPPTQTQPQTVTITAKPGTVVKHSDVTDNARSGQIGTVAKRTSTLAMTLDVLWHNDGTIEQVDPDNLLLNNASEPPQNAAAATSTPDESVYTRDKSFYESHPGKGYKTLLSDKFPPELRCPLDSIVPSEIDNFKFRLDNFLFSGHPHIRSVITGDFEPPLLTYGPYLEYMRDKCSPDTYIFDHSTADKDIAAMRKEGKFDLAKECEIVLDNPPRYDGFRPCNQAIYFTIIKSLHGDDVYIMREITYGDGISLRNLIWETMSGDDVKSKKLMAMSLSEDITQVKYRFVRHGVRKYFAGIHKALAKLKSLGASKQDWEVFGAIFVHMEKQCEEYRQVVVALRDRLATNDNALTIKSIEQAFTTKETVHRIGIDNRGTPLNKPISLTPAPTVSAASANHQRSESDPSSTPSGRSKTWPEDNAVKNYGRAGSHKKGVCPYPPHKHRDDHCWHGCSKCGGCEIMHKRTRLLDEGKKLCMKHKHSLHLEKNCWDKKGTNFSGGRKRNNGSFKRRVNDSSRDGKRGNRYHAKSAQQKNRRSRSRSRSRSRNRGRSHSRSRSPVRRRRSHSPSYDRNRGPTNVFAKFVKPRYLRALEQFIHHGHKGRAPRDPSYPWSSASSRSAMSSHHNQPSAASSQYSSQSVMQRQTMPRRDTGHDPHRDGIDTELIKLIDARNAKCILERKRIRSQKIDTASTRCTNLPTKRNRMIANNTPTHNRHVVASATKTPPRKRARQALVDTGAGLTVCNNKELYVPNSIHPFPGEVLWGDGSAKKIKYAGRGTAMGKMINTGGDDSTTLLSVGSGLDEAEKQTGAKFIHAFDTRGSYLIRNAVMTKDSDGSIGMQMQQPAEIMQTSTRSAEPSAVYEAPLYDDRVPNVSHTKQISAMRSTVLPDVATLKDLPIYPHEPKWQNFKHNYTIFDAKVAVPSMNVSTLTKEIMRRHNAWGHPGPRVLRAMLRAKGTQHSKRLSRKVMDLFQPCNACLSGSSHKQPHVRDPEQPTTKATRALQHVSSDCNGPHNIFADTPTMSDAKFIFIILCQYSHFLWLWLLASTKQVTKIVEEWLRVTIKQKARLRRNNDTAIETWRTDNGPDFPQAFTSLLSKNSIYHQRTASKTSQHNPGAEGTLNVIETKVRTSLAWSRGPRTWWGEAALHTCVTKNHMSCLSNPDNASPITVLFGRKPDYAKLHPFGCLAFIHIPKGNRHGALNMATHYGALMGYATGSDCRILGYRIYNYTTHRFVYPSDVTFNDDIPAVPYISSLMNLSPSVRLKNRRVRKSFNNVEYEGKVILVRQDTDGETLYGVRYSDNDYEEYSLHGLLQILQEYHPDDDNDDNTLEITPFFGASKQHLIATDKVTDVTSNQVPQQQSANACTGSATPSKPPRQSKRVRVVRRPHNVGSPGVANTPSSQNRYRLRSAMLARTRTYERIRAYNAALKADVDLIPRKDSARSTSNKLTPIMLARARAFDHIKTFHATFENQDEEGLPPAVTIKPGTFVDTLPLPKDYEDAVTGPYRKYWIPAIAAELENLINYRVWKVEQMPNGAHPVKGKFVFRWKPDEHNHLDKAKARFCMQGFTQIKGIHYDKTYAPVAFATSLRLALLKLGVELDYCMDVVDLKAAYLTADIEPHITLFVDPPPGVKVEDGYGLRLIRALYGSMQGAQRLDVLKHSTLERLGFKRMLSETSVYYMPAGSELGLCVLVTVVDAFLIVAPTRAAMSEIKRRLRTVWKIVDKGPVNWMLNLRVHRDRPAGILKIDQTAYIERKLREFGIDKLPGKRLPMKPSERLSADQLPTTDQGKAEAAKLHYRSRTGGLNYLRLTRPDMCCVNSILSQYNKSWGVPHFNATTHAWQYAGATKHWGLILRKSGWIHGQPVNVVVWLDSGFASCPDTRRSRSGFFIILNGDVVDFGCKLQPGAPAQSTAAAEYRAITDALNAVIWLRSFLSELGIKIREPILFREDNEACIQMSTNFMTTKRTKHIDVKHHVIRYWCKDNIIDFTYTNTDGQLADMMTNVLSYPCFSRHRSYCMTDIMVKDLTGPFSNT